ncbi:MAG: hypothetical protein EKK59_00970, partial [Neisseriaceae bacterium]
MNSLNWEAEVFYRRLMSVVDDFGRFTAHPSLLRAALYPLKLDTVRDANMERLLALVEQARLVRVYEVAGKRYLELLDFKQQVRAKESKYPSPDGDCKPPEQHPLRTCAADAPVFGDGDGDGDEPPPPPADAGGAFARFWDAWPKHIRKVARSQCEAKWKAKGCDAMADRIVASVEAHKLSDSWRKDGGAFIPAPLVWLNQSRWEAPIESFQGDTKPWHATRKGIEDMGEKMGLGRWDAQAFNLGQGEMFMAYEKRVHAAV